MQDAKPWEWDWAAIMALVAAIVALYASWRANIIADKNISLSAELEIIKFREKWLQELRRAMADFSASVINEEVPSSLKKPMVYHQRVKLLLNPLDENYEGLNNMMAVLGLRHNLQTQGQDVQQTLKGLGAPSDMAAAVLDTENFNQRKLIDLNQKILKTEWDRLKTDLKEYKNAKNK